MRQLLAGLLFVFAFAIGASAQTVVQSDTFTFATGAVISRYALPPSCGAITAWDGVANAYPEEMGGVCLSIPGGYGASVDVPWELGYLNNGYLDPCDPISNWGPKVFTHGNGTHSGDTFTVTGSTTCPDFTGEYGPDFNSDNRLEGFSVVASYTVFKYTACNFGRCGTTTEYFLTGGTGTVTDSTIP